MVGGLIPEMRFFFEIVQKFIHAMLKNMFVQHGRKISLSAVKASIC